MPRKRHTHPPETVYDPFLLPLRQYGGHIYDREIKTSTLDVGLLLFVGASGGNSDCHYYKSHCGIPSGKTESGMEENMGDNCVLQSCIPGTHLNEVMDHLNATHSYNLRGEHHQTLVPLSAATGDNTGKRHPLQLGGCICSN